MLADEQVSKPTAAHSAENAARPDAAAPQENAPLAQVSPADSEAAEMRKNEGNALFAAHQYKKAIELYTAAIELNPFVATYYCNRSLAYTRNEEFGEAERDATTAIFYAPTLGKAYYRRAVARMSLFKFSEALKDFKSLITFEPTDKSAKKKHDECEKIYRRILFEKAIAGPALKSVSIESILGDPADIIVEQSYDGPRCDDGVFTPEFARNVVAAYEDGKQLHKKYLYMIVLASYKIFHALESLVHVSVPEKGQLTVCGDTHGQFYDLANIFKLFGEPSPTNSYVFNGDFVDRGSLSLEVIVTLLVWKLALPENMHLTRGNHETIEMNRMYGFEGEVRAKINQSAFGAFSQLFEALPLAIVIEKRIFVVHGGLPTEEDLLLEDIRKINRFKQPEPGSVMNQLLWSDPHPGVGKRLSKRGAGFQFGSDITESFLKRNNLKLIIRSHECRDAGYEYMHNQQCLTVFSAPNYCDMVGNKGAVVRIGPDLQENVEQFSAVKNPKIKVPSMSYSPLRNI